MRKHIEIIKTINLGEIEIPFMALVRQSRRGYDERDYEMEIDVDDIGYSKKEALEVIQDALTDYINENYEELTELFINQFEKEL